MSRVGHSYRQRHDLGGVMKCDNCGHVPHFHDGDPTCLYVRMQAEKPNKYFLTFAYKDQTDLQVHHSTLIYFGALSDQKAREVIAMVDMFFTFNYKPFPIQACFNVEDFFGVEKNIRVLRPSNGTSDFNRFLPLRDALEHLRGGDPFPFNPHFTTPDRKKYYGTIDRLVLCRNKYEVVTEWRG